MASIGGTNLLTIQPSRSTVNRHNMTTIKMETVNRQNMTTTKMEAKFYKWSAPFSDGIDQVVMIYSGISCRVNDYGINQKIEYFDYEVIIDDDMEPATKEEFITVHAKVYGDLFRRMLNI